MIQELSTLDGSAKANYHSRPKTYHVALSPIFDKSTNGDCPVAEREMFYAAVRIASKSFSFEVYKKSKQEKQELIRAKLLAKALKK